MILHKEKNSKERIGVISYFRTFLIFYFKSNPRFYDSWILLWHKHNLVSRVYCTIGLPGKLRCPKIHNLCQTDPDSGLVLYGS